MTLGRSGLRVSPLCLGAMTFGEDLGWGTSVEESQQIIDRYIELGGNFIDTANFYTRSHSEKILGDHIGRHTARLTESARGGETLTLYVEIACNRAFGDAENPSRAYTRDEPYRLAACELRRFDPEVAPLLRGTLLRLAGER